MLPKKSLRPMPSESRRKSGSSALSAPAGEGRVCLPRNNGATERVMEITVRHRKGWSETGQRPLNGLKVGREWTRRWRERFAASESDPQFVHIMSIASHHSLPSRLSSLPLLTHMHLQSDCISSSRFSDHYNPILRRPSPVLHSVTSTTSGTRCTCHEPGVDAHMHHQADSEEEPASGQCRSGKSAAASIVYRTISFFPFQAFD